jgi:Ca-activated chloride channel family protein
MIFSSPTLLILLVLGLTIVGLLVFRLGWQTLLLFEEHSFWVRMKSTQKRMNSPRVKFVLLLATSVLVSIAVLGPSWGQDGTRSSSTGADVLFTLDVSKSMDALDMSTDNVRADRLNTSKVLISQLVNEHPENRYGLVLFAGDAFVSSPLTSDTSAFLTFLQSADTQDIAVQGTDLGGAISLSLVRFDTSAESDDRGRVILLISDGGEDDPGDIAVITEVAKDQGIRIYTLGVGSDEGARIPEGQDFFGNISYKHHEGVPVITKLNSGPLERIASQTDGKYFHLESADDLEELADELQKLDTSIIEIEKESTKNNQYQIFLLLGSLMWLGYIFNQQLSILEKPRKTL